MGKTYRQQMEYETCVKNNNKYLRERYLLNERIKCLQNNIKTLNVEDKRYNKDMMIYVKVMKKMTHLKNYDRYLNDKLNTMTLHV